MVKIRNRIMSASCVFVLGAGLTLLAGSPAAEAAGPVCRKVRAGEGGLDTLRVCTTITVRTVQSTATFFTSRARPAPTYITLYVDLGRNGEVIRFSDPPCQAVGTVGAYDKLECKTPVAGNVIGTQKYNSYAWVEADGNYSSTFSPNNYG